MSMKRRWQRWRCHTIWCVFKKVSLLSFTRVLCRDYWLEKDCLHKSNGRNIVSGFGILAHKRFKIAPIFGSLLTILLWIVGELAGRGFVTVAVAGSDMWQVTSDTQTWNLSRTHGQCPCKFLPPFGKIKLWTDTVCRKLTYHCNVYIFSQCSWSNSVKLGRALLQLVLRRKLG